MISIGASPYSYNYKKPVIAFGGISIVLTILFMLYQKFPQQSFFTVETSYQFHVFCPISSPNDITSYLPSNSFLSDKQIQSLYANSYDQYAVFIQAYPSILTDPSSPAQLYYCGKARTWNGTCNNSVQICSSPGPMFRFEVNTTVDVIWINAIKTTGLNWTIEGCYDS